VFSFYDISERKRAEKAGRVLADAGVALASSLDMEVMLERFARLTVPQCADWCVVDLLEQGVLRRAAIAHSQREHEDLARDLGGISPGALEQRHPLRLVLAGGRAELGNRPIALAAALALPKHAPRELASLACGGYLVVPLVLRGTTVGAITFVAAPSSRFDEIDRANALELGRASDGARQRGLYQEAEQASCPREESAVVARFRIRSVT
jgi:hypothetical protein